jgi:hypothetical protein
LFINNGYYNVAESLAQESAFALSATTIPGVRMLEKHEAIFSEKLHFYKLDQIARHNDTIINALHGYEKVTNYTRDDGRQVRIGARQTPMNLLDNMDNPFPLLKSTWHSIVETLEKRPVIASKAWAVLMNKSDCQEKDSVIRIPHEHHPWHWSAVYYVKVPKKLNPEREGAIVFHNPLPYQYSDTIRIPPEEGLLIVFHSYMLHGIEHFSCDGERISISLNAVISPS